jgi:hypothetical protein
MGVYKSILRQRKIRRNYYLYEVTVGGGLKIISTLRGLLTGGDRYGRCLMTARQALAWRGVAWRVT